MSDRAAVLLAIAAASGVLAARPLPLALAAALVAIALAWRRPVILCVAAFVLASCLGARAWEGVAPVAPAPFAGSVTLASDPESFGPAVRAEVRSEGHRYEAWFRGGAAGSVRSLLAGDGVEVTGRVVPRPDGASWLAARHVVGRISVQEIGATDPADGAARVANRLRRTIGRGAEHLGTDERALLLGVLVGDDREQSPLVADDFRAAGMGHLLAVSGQNVAFVLVAVGPLLRRTGLSLRLLLTFVVLAGFALLTRFEPSVLRATTMAAIAATGVAVGRPAPALRNLALAVAALILVDPLLVHTLGFALSVAASASILVVGPHLSARVPGPRWLVEPLTVTVAAQVGVAPILLWAFGGIPVASVPANVLVAPAVAPLTIWGMTAGLAAGALDGVWGTLLHLPTRLLSAWLLGVARLATRARLGELDGWGAAVVAIGLFAWWHGAGGARRRWLVRAGAGAVLVACLVPAVAARRPLPRLVQPVGGVQVWHDGGTVVMVGGDVRPGDALEGLRRSGLASIDLLVLESAGRAGRDTLEALVERYRPKAVWVPSGTSGGATPEEGSWWDVGNLRLQVRGGTGTVTVQVLGREGTLADAVLGSARAPPPRSAPPRRLHAGARDGHPQPDA